MQLSPESEPEIIDDFEAVRLLINVYLIKKVKCLNKPINQEKFVDNVSKEFRNRSYNYPRKRILYTWKHLLDNYQHYKKYFTNDNARKEWKYFDLMDNCFDDSKPSSEKFKDPKWTFFLLESLTKHKPIILYSGFNMDILQAVEDNFRDAGKQDINQKDIYNQWLFLKRFYRQNEKNAYYKNFSKNSAYFDALKEFFELVETVDGPAEYPGSVNVSENELWSAVESVKEGKDTKTKEQKTNSKHPTKRNLPTQNVNKGSTSFNILMHDILLKCFKRNKKRFKNVNGTVNKNVLKQTLQEFKKLGYAVTLESISNEWNDLSCRYELIKNSEHPEKWPYYNDMCDIYNKDKLNDQLSEMDDQDNQSTIGSIIVESLRKDQTLKTHEYAKLTERLLNVYESNSKEFLEIKDILLERNLLKEETNYLLDIFVTKLTEKKES